MCQTTYATNLLQEKVGYLASIRLSTPGELNLNVLSLQEKIQIEAHLHTMHRHVYCTHMHT